MGFEGHKLRVFKIEVILLGVCVCMCMCVCVYWSRGASAQGIQGRGHSSPALPMALLVST